MPNQALQTTKLLRNLTAELERWAADATEPDGDSGTEYEF